MTHRHRSWALHCVNSSPLLAPKQWATDPLMRTMAPSRRLVGGRLPHVQQIGARCAISQSSSSALPPMHTGQSRVLTMNRFMMKSQAASPFFARRGLGSIRSSSLLSNVHSPSQSLYWQQQRQYIFLPTSWTELKLRMRTVTKARTVKVKLWRDKTILVAKDQYVRAKIAGQRVRTYVQSKQAKYFNQAKEAYQSTLSRPGSLHKFYRDRARVLSLRKLRDRGMEWIKRIQRLRFVPKKHPLIRRSIRLQKQLHRRQERIVKIMQRARMFFIHAYQKRKILPVKIKEYAEMKWFDPHTARPLVAQDETGRFLNPWMSESTNGVKTIETLVRWRWGRLQREWEQYGMGLLLPTFLKPNGSAAAAAATTLTKRPEAVPIPKPLTDPSILRCTLIGHSTCWIQKGKLNMLTDPIFSDRASPFQNSPIGVARDFPPACSIDDLPVMDVCMISHDHYDHLDKTSVRNLKDKVKMWLVPLGIGDWLQEKADIPEEQIVELAWWDSVLLRRGTSGDSWHVADRHSPHDQPKKWDALVPRHPAWSTPATPDQFWITACPTQHWSSRTFFDRNYRLWASFVVFLDQAQTFYFTGDTGLPTEFPLFEQISDYVGRPVDLAAIPIGAYDPRFLNYDAHLDPFEAVQVHQKLQCRKSIAIHHGSFPLGEESHDEPAELLKQATAAANVTTFEVVPDGGSVSIRAG